MADQQQQQQQGCPFPTSVAVAVGGTAAGGMAELDQALGLATAWLDGDEAVAAWAADPGASDPPTLDGQPQQRVWPTWQGEEDAPALQRQDDELDALLLGGPDPLLQQGLDSQGSGRDNGEGDVGAIPALSAAGGGGGSSSGEAAAAAASEVARGVEGMYLDDIDAELADSMAPGTGPLSLEPAVLGQGAAAAAALEAAPPPIVPAPTDLEATEEDPLAALAAAIEVDKPKFKPSPEWVQMMEAVEGELQEAADAGQPTLVDPPAGARPAASGSGVGGSAMQGVEVQQPEARRQDAEMGEAADAGASASSEALPRVLPGAAKAQPTIDSWDQECQRTFAVLQPICSLLLLHRGEPQTMAELLAALAAALEEASQAGLQQCLDYVLFPLLMMLDAIAATRQASGAGSSGASGGSQAARSPAGEGAAAGALMALPAMGSDRAAEAALGCVLRVLRRCPAQSGDALLGMLRRLASLLELPPGAASEEIREGALRCLEAAATCTLHREAPPGVREALQGEAAAPLLGYLFSLLLQVAEAEAQHGSSGSKVIRDAALQALLRLLASVAGTAQKQAEAAAAATAAGAAATPAVLPAEAQTAADALAFFLPGVAVGLCKALLLAASSGGSAGGGRAPTGPASSSAAAVAALQALVTLLVACLGDAAVEAALHGVTGAGAGSGRGGSSRSAWQGPEAADTSLAAGSGGNLQQALEQLQALAQRAKGGAVAPAAAAAATGTAGPIGQPLQQHPRQPGRMRVDRCGEWVQDSEERLHELLSTALPPLLAHQRAAVRKALVAGCCRLLDSCSMALQPRTQEVLLQLLLSAAQDEWQEVATPARAWLKAQAAAASSSAAAAPQPAAAGGGGSSGFAAASERLLLQLLEGLPAALRSGDVPGRQHAQQLTSAIQVCPPAWFAANVVQHPLRLQQLLAAFLEAFAFDASIAGMLLFAAAAPAGSATSYTAGAAAAGGDRSGESQDGTSSSGGGSNRAASAQQQQQQQGPAEQQMAGGGAGAVVLLPRMPLGLVLITTAKTYEAVAAALRATAALAAAADAGPGSTGTALRCLIDGCLSRLQQLIEAAADAISGSGSSCKGRPHKRSCQTAVAGGDHGAQQQQQTGAAAGQVPWKLQAASVAVVLAELLLGASPAWQPSWRIGPEAATGGGSAPSASSPELEALAAAVVQDLVQDAIWSLPTSVAAEGPDAAAASGSGAVPLRLEAAGGGGSPQQQRLMAQQLGCNALLQKAAVECCGAAARALGPRFSQNGRLLRTALLPLLEKLADGAQLVAAAAQAAVGSICWWCGYGGSLRRLVGANADYVVDGMCRQLRQLDSHPRAPQLFMALLQTAGVAPELLPLLAEPARGAVAGLGILARRQQPQHVLAFLQALLPIAAAAGAEAQQALGEMRQLATAVQERWEERQRELDEREAVALAAAGGSAAAASRLEIRRFFERRQQRRARQEQPGAVVEEAAEGNGAAEGYPVEEAELEEEERKVPLSAAEREHISLQRRHAHAAGGLAQAVADAASPLFAAHSLGVAVQSFGVVAAALQALAATTEAVELDTNQIQMLARRRTDVAAPDPDTPRLLPSVHLAWVPLMGALQDWRVSVVEAALQFLADVACLAGSFLRKRFVQEAASALRRLLAEGPARRNIIAPGQDDLTSPATVQRAQLAALRCLHQIASCDRPLAIAGVSSSASEALLPAAGALLAAVGEAMGARQPAPVREQATQTYVALARVDPDAAWSQLSAALQAAGGSNSDGEGENQPTPPDVPAGLTLQGSGERLTFPGQQQIAPTLPPAPVPPAAAAGAGRRQSEAAAAGAVQMSVPPGLRQISAAKLAAMLRQVEALPPRWHLQAEALLERQ